MSIKTMIRDKMIRTLGDHGYTMVEADQGMDVLETLMNLKTIDFSNEDFENRDKTKLVLSWVIPPMGPGSGGHTTIFRTIHFLQELGITSRVYQFGGNENIPGYALQQTAKDWYGYDMSEVEMFANFRDLKFCDAVIATSWQTAYIVRKFNNCISKFYFVQDYEPYFYAKGSNYYLAENTYKFGFRGITAGLWLTDVLKKEYSAESVGFHFSYDRNIYHSGEKKDDKNRIFFYARPYTERRAYEMGILAIQQLAKKVPDLEVVFAGQEIHGDYGFKYINKGIMPPKEMSDIYSQCDLCLVLSMTNMSLLPLEVMASNSVVVSNKGANNEWQLNDENAILTENDPMDIAEKMEYYLNNKKELIEKRENGKKYADSFTWQDEMLGVAEFIKKSVSIDLQKMNK